MNLFCQNAGISTSLFVRNLIVDHLNKNRAGIVKGLILSNVEQQSLTHTVTVSFVRAKEPTPEAAYRQLSSRDEQASGPKNFALFQRNKADGHRMVRSYFCSMRRKFGRNGKLPAIGVYETKRNRQEDTFLHYHCLLDIPAHKAKEFPEATTAFWKGMGERHFGAPIHTFVEPVKSKEAAMRYALKHVDNDYPVDEIIMVGFHDAMSEDRAEGK